MKFQRPSFLDLTKKTSFHALRNITKFSFNPKTPLINLLEIVILKKKKQRKNIYKKVWFF